MASSSGMRMLPHAAVAALLAASTAAAQGTLLSMCHKDRVNEAAPPCFELVCVHGLHSTTHAHMIFDDFDLRSRKFLFPHNSQRQWQTQWLLVVWSVFSLGVSSRTCVVHSCCPAVPGPYSVPHSVPSWLTTDHCWPSHADSRASCTISGSGLANSQSQEVAVAVGALAQAPSPLRQLTNSVTLPST